MKFRFFQTLAAVVAAAATIGCSADSDIEVQRPDEGTTLTLRTDGIVGDTRTEFDPAVGFRQCRILFERHRPYLGDRDRCG